VDLVQCSSFSPAALELHIIGFLLVSLYRLRLCSYAFLKMHVFECEYSDKTLVLDCDCYIFFTTFYSQMEVCLCQWLCWKVPWHSRFWHCDGVAYGCLFGKISVLQFVLLEAGDWLAYIVVGCQVCVWECTLSRSRWQHGFSTLDLFGWTFLRFCDKSVVVELLGASSLWHRCDCVCLSLRLPVDCVSTPSTCLHPSLALFRATTYSRGRHITDVVICVCLFVNIMQSNPLRWIALGPDYEYPVSHSIHLSMYYTSHCV